MVTDVMATLDRDTQQPNWLRRVVFDSGRRGIVAILAVLLVLRVGYLVICPLELVPDEAYYWDWSRQLDWSYYSKPPMIAWLIALATVIGGESVFMIRLPAALLGTAGLWLVYELGRAMYDHRVGLWTMLIVAAFPGMTALCLLMTIDAPFLMAWTAALYCLWRLFANDKSDWTWLPPAILATGAGMLTKQTAFGLVPLTILFLLVSKSDRTKLKSPALWIWIVGSLAFMLPVVLWNFRHDWVTLEHTTHHFHLQRVSTLRQVTRSLEFLISQFGILSPVVCWMMFAVTGTLLTRLRQLPRRECFLMCYGAIPFVAVMVLSLFQQVQPNWAVALHLPSVVLLAAWGNNALPMALRWDSSRKWLRTGLVVSGCLSVGIAIAPFLIPGSQIAGTTLDPTYRLRGWRQLGEQVGEILEAFPKQDSVLVIAATSRGPVSELAYYLPGKPHVYRWNVGEVVDSQHDLWSGPQQAHGANAVIVTDGLSPVPKRLAAAFRSVEEIGPVTVALGPHKNRHYRVWRGESFDAWPSRLPVPFANQSKTTLQ